MKEVSIKEGQRGKDEIILQQFAIKHPQSVPVLTE
jgi:hypothetical protein